MRKIYSTISLITLMILSGNLSYAQDVLIKEDRPVSAFSSIRVSGIADVYLTGGNTEKVSVKVNNKEFNDRLKVEVVDNVLIIRMEENKKWTNTANNVKVKVFVNYKKLHGLQGSGATNIRSEGTVNADKFELKTSGANNTSLDIRASELRLESSGASNIIVTGSAQRLAISSSGASNIKAYDLSAQEVISQTSGASNAFVTAQKTLEVKASGVSNVHYKGEPEVTSREVSKLANLRKR